MSCLELHPILFLRGRLVPEKTKQLLSRAEWTKVM